MESGFRSMTVHSSLQLREYAGSWQVNPTEVDPGIGWYGGGNVLNVG